SSALPSEGEQECALLGRLHVVAQALFEDQQPSRRHLTIDGAQVEGSSPSGRCWLGHCRHLLFGCELDGARRPFILGPQSPFPWPPLVETESCPRARRGG